MGGQAAVNRLPGSPDYLKRAKMLAAKMAAIRAAFLVLRAMSICSAILASIRAMKMRCCSASFSPIQSSACSKLLSGAGWIVGEPADLVDAEGVECFAVTLCHPGQWRRPLSPYPSGPRGIVVGK